MSFGIGLFGTNGHQLPNPLPDGFPGRIVAAGVPLESCLAESGGGVDLASARRAGSGIRRAHAIAALRAGKHVYAEKPCAMTESDLDEILKAASESGKMFREMAGTAFEQPYFAMREIVQAGKIGEVVQVIAEKSYPWHEGRPQDEDVDGGLIGQCAIHGVRMVEHVAGMRIVSIEARETTNGGPGGLRMAATLMMELQNGGLASVCANYLNPRGTGVWGDESLRILGTKGLIESRQGGKMTRLVIGEADHGPIDTSGPGMDYLHQYLLSLTGRGEMALSLEEELSPTRWVIRAKAKAGNLPVP